MLDRVSWPFEPLVPSADFDEAEYGGMVDELRGMLAALAHAAPGPEQVRELTADLQRWHKELEGCRSAADDAPYGQLAARDDHGLASMPEIVVTAERPDVVRATVRFSRWHVGGGETVHGGQIATVLDELLGRTQLASGWISRTAYLNLNYRAGTPHGDTLEVEARVDRVEGRKNFVTARLFAGEVTYAEADALFINVAPYPGAPDPHR